MEKFKLDGHEFIELHNLLKITGSCNSGGHAKAIISDGLVKVDNKVELRKRCKIRHNQMVEFNGQQIQVT